MYGKDLSISILIRFNKSLQKVCFMLELTLKALGIPKQVKLRSLPDRSLLLAM